MSALVLLISLAACPLPTRLRPISPALRPFPFLSTRFQSPIAHRIRNQNTTANTTAIRTTEPGILLLRDTWNRQSEQWHPNKATTSPRAIPGVHRQLERRADSTPEIFDSTSTDSTVTVPQPLLVTTHLGDVQEGLECPRRELIGRSRVVRESNKHRTLHRHDPLAPSTMTTAVKRACDACHRRKVKCDGINPCRNCLGSQLSCTYHAIPQKKGPKGSRAKVINELKELERQTISAKAKNRMNGINSAPSSPSLAPTPGLLQSEIVKSCIDYFFAHLYRTMPILDRARLEQQALYMDQALDTYCLLTSLCAFVLLQPGMNLPGSDPYGLDSMPGANIVTSTLLMEETLRVRKGYDYMDSPTFNSLCTSYFLYGCHYGLDLQDKAWFHIREATTLIHMIGMNKEQTYLQYDSVETAKRRRLYWLLFATER